MKKMLAVVLALAVIGSMSVAAMANTGEADVTFRDGGTVIIIPPAPDPGNNIFDLALDFGSRELGFTGEFLTTDQADDNTRLADPADLNSQFAGVTIDHRSTKNFTVSVSRSEFTAAGQPNLPVAFRLIGNAVTPAGTATPNTTTVSVGTEAPVLTYTGGSAIIMNASWSAGLTVANWAGIQELSSYTSTLTWTVTNA